jgi:biopolymer transport protein ExbB/TolQ
MSNIIKILLVTTPLAGLIFYYVVVRHNLLDIELQKEALKFEREWNEFNRDFVFTRDKQAATERARKAEEELKKVEEQEQRKKEKLERLEQELEQQLNATQEKDLKNLGKKP